METKSVYLPRELIIQILLRLPVKSLIRFKCVCKSWFSLISNSASHFQVTATKHTLRVLFISTTAPETRSIDLDASLDHNSASLNLPFLLPESYSDLQIEGSCRGFIILRCSSCLYLWNPSTGFHRKIPFGSNLDTEYFYGFGYDRSTNDYLLVSVSVDGSHFELFSFRANTWTEIQVPHPPCVIYSEYKLPKFGLPYNGNIHWLGYNIDLQKDVIVAFDFIERKFFDMHFPYELSHVTYSGGLWVFGEFLGLWAMRCDNDTVEIWVMKEYKVHSSWTKTHVLPIANTLTQYFSLLCSTKSGDLIGTDQPDKLVKYNDEGKLLGCLSYYNINDTRRIQVVVYTESLLLLPLPGDNEQA